MNEPSPRIVVVPLTRAERSFVRSAIEAHVECKGDSSTASSILELLERSLSPEALRMAWREWEELAS